MVALLQILMGVALASPATITTLLPSIEITNNQDVHGVWCLPSGNIALVTNEGFILHPLSAAGGIVTESLPQGRVFRSGGQIFMGLPESRPVPLFVPEKEWGSGLGPYVSPDLELMLADQDPMRGLRILSGITLPSFRISDLPSWVQRGSAIWNSPRSAVLALSTSVAMFEFNSDGSIVRSYKLDVIPFSVTIDAQGNVWVLKSEIESGPEFWDVVSWAPNSTEIMRALHIKREPGVYPTGFKVLGSHPMILLNDGRLQNEAGDIYATITPPLVQGQAAIGFCAIRHENFVFTATLVSDGVHNQIVRAVIAER